MGLRTHRVRRQAGIIVAAVLLPLGGAAQAPVSPEWLFYMTGSDASFESFRAHVDHIDVVGPQVFAVKGDGVVWGEVDRRVLELAGQHGVRVMPLLVNRGFDQAEAHALLNDPAARARAVRSMVEIGRRDGFWGWQFDLENVHVGDRDRLTAFYREAARALHDAGMTLSIAVVPYTGEAGASSWHHYMAANWRGAFDVPALAGAGDFISYMTYAQHNVGSPPGPVAGLPWVRANLEHILTLGVPPDRISLGIPAYSGYWAPGYDASAAGTASLRPVYREVSHQRAVELLDRFRATPRWLPDQGTSMAFWEHDGVFEYLFLEDARAFRAKLALLEEYPGLRGISVWVLGAEHSDIFATKH